MSEQSESGGVFGNLPRARPGTRSPLRDPDTAAPRRATADQPETGLKEPTGPADREDRPSEPEQTPEGEPTASDQQQEPGGLEDLAWAGIAAAAEAATIGVRLASRAMEAVRDAGKRT